METTLSVDLDPRGVLSVALNRPEKRNALSATLIGELAALSARVAGDPAVRVVVLSGRGDTFCAGGDLAWMKAQGEATRDVRIAEARRLAMMLKALNELPVPVIARIHGGAYGGGVGLACISDVAIAEEGTRFGLTETRLGLIPATIGPYVVARIGEAMARRVVLSGRLFDAPEAERLGVVARVVAKGDLDDAVEAEVRAHLSAAPSAAAAAKRLLRRLGPVIDETVIDETIARLADTWETEEARHGIEAFLSRTSPRWRPET